MPVIKKLFEKQMPPFLIINNKTSHILKYNWHKGFIKLNDVWGDIKIMDKIAIPLRANKYSKKIGEILGGRKYPHNFQWISTGLLSFCFFQNYLCEDN
ncbi:MAG: hypothetical protein N2445_02030, partial [Acidobacteria bacterium]|nr:hypothetical protein [Acidobacteriota bacterium]